MAKTAQSKQKNTFMIGINISKRTLWILLAVVLVLIVVGVWLGFEMRSDDNSPYSAVYLSSGDIYFGRLDWYPRPHMTNVWYLQRTSDKNNQPQVGIMPFKSAFWGPSDSINLNSKDILFWTSLRKDSQVAKLLDNPSLINQQSAQEELPQGPSTSSTSTGK